MATTRGRWGVTRDDSGHLAFLSEWPWYWRYSAGTVITVASVAIGLSLAQSGKPDWMVWLTACGGILCALGIMYELGCLAIVLAVVGGIWWGLNLLLPDFETPQKTVNIFIGGFAFAAAYFAYDCLKAIAVVRSELEAIRMEARRMAEVTQNLIQQNATLLRQINPQHNAWGD